MHVPLPHDSISYWLPWLEAWRLQAELIKGLVHMRAVIRVYSVAYVDLFLPSQSFYAAIRPRRYPFCRRRDWCD